MRDVGAGAKSVSALVVLSLVTVAAGAAWGQKAPGEAAVQTVVLNTYGIWRFHCSLEPPVIADGQTVTLRHVWLNYRTPGPEQEWMAPDFDDTSWHRGPVTLAVRSAMLSRVCLRGKFEVTDKAAVKGLSLSVGYHGGLIVYVNGAEVKRQHIAAGQTLAEGPAGEVRELTGLSIPSNLLRKGVNVIGLEVVRAPYPEATADNVYEENSCQILRAQLVSEGASGLVPNAVRPAGLQVWNADPMAVDLSVDFGDRAEGLRPAVIIGAKNGTFTGKVVVGSTAAIQGLNVTAGELKGEGGSIPGSNVAIRYGIPWGAYRQVNAGQRRLPTPYQTYATRLGALAEQPLAEFPVLLPERGPYRPAFAPDVSEVPSPSGAVVPVWITVKVPGTLNAGTYAGTVKIEAEGQEAVEVPIEVRVADWTMPDTQDLHTFVGMVQCPDTLSLEYDVPLWSEEHWGMIADAFRVIGETGSRTVYVPLIAHTNFGNEESMVRWVKKEEDKYGYDFSVMERYLDVATKNMGTPKQVIFVVWDVYMMPADTLADSKRGRTIDTARNIEKIGGKYGMGPRVTAIDPATQKTELVELPTHFETETSRALWKPLLDQLHARMKARGLEEPMMPGVQHDAWATKEEHLLFKEISGDLPWVMQSHGGVAFNTLQYGISKIGYQDVVWKVTFSDDNAVRPKGYRGGIKSHMGWARPDLVGQFDRGNSRETSPNVFWLRLAEAAITGSQRGNGRLGADYWQVVKDKRGNRVARSHERYPESSWRNLFIPEALLAPGPTGPVATDELEAYRQGILECEARIVLEYGLDRERARMGEDLAKRCEDYLAKRHMLMWLSLSDLQLFYDHPGASWGPTYMGGFWRYGCNIGGSAWYLGSGHQRLTEELYSLAGEVTRRIGPLPTDVSKPGNWGTYDRDHR